MRLRPRGHTPVPERNDNRAGERGEEARTCQTEAVGPSRYVGNIRDVLDERKAAILQAVVQEYIRTAQPVGSNHVLGATGVEVSAATVRNDMAVLEQEGYLHQPHTSAGRVPTEKGYRFFVDSMPGRPARRRPGAAGADLLRQGARRARTDAPRHQPPADPPDRLRGRGRRRPTSKRPSAACTSSGSRHGSCWPSPCCRTARSSARRSSSAPSSRTTRSPPPSAHLARAMVGSTASARW